MCVQYIKGMFSTSGGGGVQYIGGYHEYIGEGGILSISRDIMIHMEEQVDKSL